MLSKASPTEVLRWQEMICSSRIIGLYLTNLCSASRLEISSSWAVRGLERTVVESRRAGSSNHIVTTRDERESVGVGWKLESELPLRPDVPCVLSPSLQQGLHHSTLYCTTDYCTTEKLELPFCCLEWGVVNIISILIPENTSKTKVTGRQRSYLLVLSVRNRWFSKQ